jgi:hypothetical protein
MKTASFASKFPQQFKCQAALSVLGFVLAAFSAPAQGWDFEYTIENGTITITKYIGSGGAVIIPAAFGGVPVTRIGTNAFLSTYRDILKSVTIPNSVTDIEEGAFEHCYGLSSVAIGNGVTSIGADAFRACTNLYSITIPNSVISIGTGIFSANPNLTTVTIGNGVTSIGDRAFWECWALSGVYFVGDAPSIGTNLFYQSTPTIYYRPETTGWGQTFGGRPTARWVLPSPIIVDGSTGPQNEGFGFSVSGSTFLPSVVVEATTSLDNPIWSPVSTNSLVGGSSYFCDPDWTNYPARFYRIRSL